MNKIITNIHTITGIEVKVNPTEKDLNNLKGLSSGLGIEEFNLVSKNFNKLENTVYGFTL